MAEHPLVSDYLKSFDSAAARIPLARRRLLRAEIVSHLTDTVPWEATNEQARLTMLEFGTPQEIVTQEGGPERPRTTAWWWIGAAAAAALLVIAAGIAVGVTQLLVPESSGVLQLEDDSVVSANPNGPERVIEGQAFSEYAGTADQMPPLPEGAEWPLGVIEGLDAGLVADGSGVLEAGVGAWTARFTWLCAWEGEYLSAAEAEDEGRIADAFKALEYWADTDFWYESDPSGGWRSTVVDPLRNGDLSALRANFPETCFQAGIETR